MRVTEAQQWEANVRASARSRTNVFLLSPCGAEQQGRAGQSWPWLVQNTKCAFAAAVPERRRRLLAACTVISRAFTVPLSSADRSDLSEQPDCEVNRATSYS